MGGAGRPGACAAAAGYGRTRSSATSRRKRPRRRDCRRASPSPAAPSTPGRRSPPRACDGPATALLVYGTTMFLIEVGTPARPTRASGAPPASRPGIPQPGRRHGLGRRPGRLGAPSCRRGVRSTLDRRGRRRRSRRRRPLALPYFAGERTPLFDPDARGLVLGPHHRAHAAARCCAPCSRARLRRAPQPGGDARGRRHGPSSARQRRRYPQRPLDRRS